MSTRSPRCVVLVGFVVVAAALAACVGDAPYGAASDDADAAPATSAPGADGGAASTTPDHGDAGPTTAPPQDAATTDSSAPADAATADTAPPRVACSEEAIVTGAYNFRCSAAQAATTPGGTVQVGTYLLTRYWDSSACASGTFQIGWGEVFEQDGATYLRYVRIERVQASDPGTKHVGTFRLDAGALGALDRTEMCDLATLGAKTTGQYEMTPAGATAPLLTLSFVDRQERWTKQ